MSLSSLPVKDGQVHLDLGTPLPCDIYDQSGNLLLSKGTLLKSERQLDYLIESGFIRNDIPDAVADSKDLEKTRFDQSNISVVHLYDNACADLKVAFENLLTLQSIQPIQDYIFSIVDKLLIAIENSPDIALACIFFNRDTHDSLKHSVNTAILSVFIAQAMKKPEREVLNIAAASLTMDIGLTVQDLNLNVSELRDSENLLDTIESHPTRSRQILEQAGVDNQDWLNHVEQHHEVIDGSGYPSNLTDDAISENSQIISLADQYLELVEPRNGQQGCSPHRAIRDILTVQGQTIRADLAAYLIRTLSLYPPGSVVRLKNAEIGVVTKRHKNGKDFTVEAVISPRGAKFQSPVKRETEHDIFNIQEALTLNSSQLNFTMEELWGKLARLAS